MNRPGTLAIRFGLLLWLSVVSQGFGATVVAPNSFAALEDDGQSGDLIVPIRLQEIYSSSHFPGTPIEITELRFRRDAGQSPFSTTIANIQLTLSTTPKSPDQLSSTFANNFGADAKVVFSGALSVDSSLSGPPGGPNPFDIVVPLTPHFLYDPSAGNLLLEIRNFSGSATTRIDASNDISDGASRAFSLNPNSSTADFSLDTGADVVELTYSPFGSPPPDPFTKVTFGPVVTDGGNSHGMAWGDYDGDGNLDLFVANASGQNNFLYHNNGDGTFTKITIGSVVNDGGNSTGCAWGDYDNDGHLDLFVANAYESNFLYHNISIVISATPNPVVQGSLINYTIIVANNGPGTALGVMVFDVLPSGLNFLFAFSTQGSCSGSSTVTCNVGSLAPGSSAIITILASPAPGGVHPPTYLLANSVTVTANSTDPAGFNNSDIATSTVRTDSDGDGLPDDYEDQNGLDKNSAADGSLDLDGDGFSNLQEFLVGTDPRNPRNAFVITDTETLGNDVQVTFSTASGKTYSAQYSDTSPSGPWTVFAAGIPGTGGLVQVLDLGGASQPLRFYRAEMAP